MNWQPIETAPKDREIILCRGDRVSAGQWIDEIEIKESEYHANGTYLGKYPSGDVIPGCWMSWDGGFTESEPPTMWMPLPAPHTDEFARLRVVLRLIAALKGE